MAVIAIHPRLYKNPDFPLWQSSTLQLNDDKTEQISPFSSSIQSGDIIKLGASQQYYSFDYYAIYPPHTIYSAGAFWYTTYKGFTASYDPDTYIRIGENADIIGSDGKIQAIYR